MTATPGMFCAAIVTTYSGIAMPMTACQLQCGTVISSFGIRSATGIERCPAIIEIPAPATAVAKAPGTAHRCAYRCSTTHTTSTGATTAALEVVRARSGARQSGSRTPASMACAISTGIAVISRPSRDQQPVRTINTPVTANAPTAAGQPPVTAPAPASSAAPGVDQARVIGMR